MASYGTVLKTMDGIAKASETFYEYSYKCIEAETAEEFMGLEGLADYDEDVRFVYYLYMEGLAWTTNHADKPISVVYYLGSEKKSFDFEEMTRESMLGWMNKLERRYGANASVHLEPKRNS